MAFLKCRKKCRLCDSHVQCERYSTRHKGTTLKFKTSASWGNCVGVCVCRCCSILVSHRCAVSFHRLLQVVIVGQNLHEEVKLQSLRLQDKKPTPGYANLRTKLCDSRAQASFGGDWPVAFRSARAGCSLNRTRPCSPARPHTCWPGSTRRRCIRWSGSRFSQDQLGFNSSKNMYLEKYTAGIWNFLYCNKWWLFSLLYHDIYVDTEI